MKETYFKPIDPALILFLDNVDKILEKDTFICNSCRADDWFDCDCSEYESESEKKIAKGQKKIIKTSGEIDTNENTSEIEKRLFCKIGRFLSL